MSKDRKVNINGEIIIADDCNLDELVKDIFACLKKHNANHNIRIYELIDSEEQAEQNQVIHDIIEKRLEQRNIR